MDFDDIPENLKTTVLDVMKDPALQEGLKIKTVQAAHSKYMKMKSAQKVSDKKPGPSKGKAGGKGPKYMPKGRVNEQSVLTETSPEKLKRYLDKAPGDAKGKLMQAKYDQGARSVGPNRAEVRARGVAGEKKALQRFDYVDKARERLGHPKPTTPPSPFKEPVHVATYENGPKVAHVLYDNGYQVHQYVNGKLSAPPTKYSKREHADHHAKFFTGADSMKEDVNEGWLSNKVKSIRKYVTGEGKAQQERLKSKLKDQIKAQPAKIARADNMSDQIDAKERMGDLKKRYDAVDNPEWKRTMQDDKIAGHLTGKGYLSGRPSTANHLRSAARSARRLHGSLKGISDKLPQLNATLDNLQQIIAKKKAARQEAARRIQGAAQGAALGNPALGQGIAAASTPSAAKKRPEDDFDRMKKGFAASAAKLGKKTRAPKKPKPR